ncbi:DUF397 domain-containing protein [Saccharopolyspora shandongensis]|uniref:DUF397 domain-containing protein n=1 Tax=Saccharopolyspora shandongensis TaxID=418495 RepID=UPI00340DCF56
MADIGWFKSSYSSNDSDNCVEVRLGRGVVGVRDSKDRGGPALWVGASGWGAFVGHVKAGGFDADA